ncbi:cysteine hydrolase family protein [Chromobacterium violaceum]|uniref:Probable amidase from nicotinamidase family n=1 Tax=Chromobacterium violaceum (strain ATCC 12472 / DSM 30191 / JCM 1249 / CCUG 213 / NBRC 12614 / NCIMB 9131 / NCTC 9757 / MK) TaxID=243365 RepID=Q7NQA1_CHRVO|nr:cysteine hydrolase family protein [Chromobacterium violaceum]AAQ61899.1 probable amidase from nicotinamidase family [Chromobacterium violaceum ATCC 12472]SUX40889.1 Isochorismatase family protein yecD [Chromobacterium violaceum]
MSDTALLIIDVQVGVVEGEPRAARLDSVLDSLNLAILKARQRGMPVIFVQHEEDDLPRGSDAWQLHPKLARQDGDPIIYKRYGDSFCETDLAQLLSARGASKLWVGGAATDFCVDSTLRNAVSRGYQVTAIADGHTTLSAFALSGEQVIDHFNAIWQASSATPQPLRVLPAAEL